MKKTLLLLIAAISGLCAASAQDGTVVLDLTKATTPLTFDQTSGAWTGTYDDDETSIESQCFSFVHTSYDIISTWWGFTASNSANNNQQSSTLDYQWSNMALGGIELNDDGTIKLNDFGAPSVSADVPYLVAYYNAYMSRKPVQIVFNDGKNYDPQGVYLNLNSYAYYSIVQGDGFCRAFTQGDKFTLTFHGVAPDESEKTLDMILASSDNGMLTAATGWMYVDLTPLGTVNEIYCTMASTDTGAWGMNTPGYFCMDKLSVKPATGAGVENIAAGNAKISYDRATATARIEGAEFAVIVNTAGQTVMSGEGTSFNLSSLPAGVYVIKAGNSRMKIAR